ncbi:hypothetical protein [Streptacidiphilus sp. MAP5-52]|uniref:hypothetical protein n=1 Tax=Streptacidiphilus sp. MAP5-52 TaxID=3156267 RepID=UPI003518B677
MTSAPRRGLGPGGTADRIPQRTPPWAKPTSSPPPAARPASAEQALQALSGLRMVPVQLGVLEAALGLARTIQARGRAEEPAVQESSRALTVLLETTLARVPPPLPTQAPPTARPTATGTGTLTAG